MQVILAETMGMCFGVRDAVAAALEHPRPHELTVLGELVHNPSILARLERAGVRRVDGPGSPVHTPAVMVTAHGVSDHVRRELSAGGREVLDGTCPLVRHAHEALRLLVSAGFFPVVIGQAEHVEVRGLVGDLQEYAVVHSEDDLDVLAGRPRLGLISQTTQPPARVARIVAAIRDRFPEAEVRHRDTVCRPTRDRQAAAEHLGRTCDVVIVVGGRNSSNSRHLRATAAGCGARAYLVEGPRELEPQWFRDVGRVGLTAGTSTPDEAILAVHAAILQLGASTPSSNRAQEVPA